MAVIERTDNDIEQETIQLWQKVKPLLDNGMSFYPAVRQAKGLQPSSCLGTQSWFRRLRTYAIKQGYTLKKVGRNSQK